MPRNTTVPVCPYCESIYDDWELDLHSYSRNNLIFTPICENCGKEFKCVVHVRRTFSTEKTGD